jgi:hypothetical protein
LVTLSQEAKLRLILFIFFFVVLAITIGIRSAVLFSYPKVDFNSEVDPSVISGLLTAFAIIFGFASNQIREIRVENIERFLLSAPLVFSFLVAVAQYSSSIFQNGYPTYWVLLTMSSGIIFTIFYLFELVFAKVQYDNLPG